MRINVLKNTCKGIQTSRSMFFALSKSLPVTAFWSARVLAGHRSASQSIQHPDGLRAQMLLVAEKLHKLGPEANCLWWGQQVSGRCCLVVSSFLFEMDPRNGRMIRNECPILKALWLNQLQHHIITTSAQMVWSLRCWICSCSVFHKKRGWGWDSDEVLSNPTA